MKEVLPWVAMILFIAVLFVIELKRGGGSGGRRLRFGGRLGNKRGEFTAELNEAAPTAESSSSKSDQASSD